MNEEKSDWINVIDRNPDKEGIYNCKVKMGAPLWNEQELQGVWNREFVITDPNAGYFSFLRELGTVSYVIAWQPLPQKPTI